MAITPAIPASQVVAVNPSVLSAGGSALDLSGLILTTSFRVPTGSVLSFANLDDVEDHFGSASNEAALAAIYFLGFDNSNRKPGALLFWQYATTAQGGRVLGGDVSGLPLATLQGLNGTLTFTLGGVLRTGTVNLSAATSFSSVGVIIADTLDIPGAQSASITGSIASNVLTVSAVASGTLSVGDILGGTSSANGRYISALASGTGGTGTYTLNGTAAIPSQTITLSTPGVTYDSTSGGFIVLASGTGTGSTVTYGTGTIAGNLGLTQATGAILSQGVGVSVPGTAMDAIVDITQNWASFMTMFEPSDADKELFADWNNSQNNRYCYVMWDSSILDIQTGAGSAPVAYINAGSLSGIAMIYEDLNIDTIGGEPAAFIMGTAASIDFTQTQGRITFAQRHQTGLQPQVFNGTVAANLGDKNVNFYGDYTTANDAFVWLRNGAVSGPFKWLDSYYNQIWLNNQLQLSLMVLLDQARSIPYNTSGYAMIEAACLDVINQAVNFGAIQPGVTLSESQKVQVNTSAGVQISDILGQRGWYLQVKDANPQVRAARGSPPITFWYMDGESIQTINLASILVQ